MFTDFFTVLFIETFVHCKRLIRNAGPGTSTWRGPAFQLHYINICYEKLLENAIKRPI